MRWCSHCRRYNSGWPTRCRYCAAGLAGRLCERGHINPSDPRLAFCGECGQPLERTWGTEANHRLYALATLVILAASFLATLPLLLFREEAPVASSFVSLLILVISLRIAFTILPPSARSIMMTAFRGFCSLLSFLLFGTGLKGKN
jgi:hypothetical protein